jgi:3-oxoacyl-[acyl-carrier-protein] synthase-3
MKHNLLSIEKYLPARQIASEELDILAGGTVGRIEKNTGVQFRHHVSGDESVAEMGVIALRKALASAKLEPKDLDLLLYAGGAFDYPIPHNSVLIKSKLTDDSVHFYCMDIDSTCLSFLNALDVAHLFMDAGRYQRIAIVCSEISSKALSPTDEKVFGLFGDAAVAAILESSEHSGYVASHVGFTNYPSGALYANVGIGGAINRGINAAPTDPGFFFQMDGTNMIRLTLSHMDAFVAEIEAAVGHPITEFDHIVTHQASKFGNSYIKNQFKVDAPCVVETLAEYGNCISASIPLGLEKLVNSGVDLKNKRVLLLGSGAGLSLGAIVLDFATSV